MSIRIEKIKINRNGPLKERFDFDPSDINLVYGHNERGKSYIVEALIQILFRNKKSWNPREIEMGGRVTVTGLAEREVVFSKTGDKLDDYFDTSIGLPQDYSRLLVVKEGETLLQTEKTSDGVGRTLLKNFLSGEGVLDSIAKRISLTLQNCKIERGIISGKDQGEVNIWNKLRAELFKLDKLIIEGEDAYTSSKLYEYKQQETDVSNRLSSLEEAKRHHAFCLDKQIKDCDDKLNKLPDAEEISQIDADIKIYQNKKEELDRKEKRLNALSGSIESYSWIDNAGRQYKELILRPAHMPSLWLYLLLTTTILCTLLTGIDNFGILFPIGSFEIPTLFAISAAAMVFVILIFIRCVFTAMKNPGTAREIESIREGYKQRFGCDFNDIAELESRTDKLEHESENAKSLNTEIEDSLKPLLQLQEWKINIPLGNYYQDILSNEKWDTIVKEIRKSIRDTNVAREQLVRDLAKLDVEETDYVKDATCVSWDIKPYRTLNEELNETKKNIESENSRIGGVKTAILHETRIESQSWDDLLQALREKREHTAREYMEHTAIILAKICISDVLKLLREEENKLIDDGLKKPEITTALNSITGQYKSIRLDPSTGLMLTNDEDEEFALASLSTAAKEQTHLTLRMGFASLSLRNNQAFLILDDAFQHSDWVRRPRLIYEVINLASRGWQIIYFTMDDHIRDLFLGEGEKLGNRFKYYPLN